MSKGTHVVVSRSPFLAGCWLKASVPHCVGLSIKIKWSKVKSLSCVRLFATPWAVACTRLLCPWDFLGKSTGVGCHFPLQGIFPTQRSNPGLPDCRQMLYHLSHQWVLGLSIGVLKTTTCFSPQAGRGMGKGDGSGGGEGRLRSRSFSITQSG